LYTLSKYFSIKTAIEAWLYDLHGKISFLERKVPAALIKFEFEKEARELTENFF
jgi:hypothetical protein